MAVSFIGGGNCSIQRKTTTFQHDEQTGGYEPNMYIVDTSGVLLIENNCNETTKLTNVALTSSSPQNLYICETCGTLFKQKWQLNKHMVTHGELPYICKLF
jgi:hypothetical protein